MATLTGIRNKLANKMFAKFGVSATRTPFTSATIDKWGDATDSWGTAVTITIIPYNYITSRLNYQPFGDLREDEVVIIISYDTTLNENDKVTYESTDYRVVEIEKFVFGGDAAKSARLSKRL